MKILALGLDYTMWKVSKCGVFSGLYFPVFSPNTGKYGPGKTPYLDTFHAMWSWNYYWTNELRKSESEIYIGWKDVLRKVHLDCCVTVLSFLAA